jgi:hypothetical protein
MSARKLGYLLLGGGLLISFLAVSLILIGVPSVYDSFRWHFEETSAALRDVVHPHADTLPTPVAELEQDTSVPPTQAIVAAFDQPDASPTLAPAATDQPDLTPTPDFEIVAPPPSMTLTGAKHEYQGPNNCGPTTLAMNMSYYGWQGDQNVIAAVLKPGEKDKNVRWDELVYYVKTHAGWLNATFRVGGTEDIVKRFVANGYPVILEKGFMVRSGWVGHYVLITGYDDATQSWIDQDATNGPDQHVTYAKMDSDWQEFNRLYILVYPVGDEAKIMALLGPEADEKTNRQHALEAAQAETQSEPSNAFTWFNLGSNLNYFDRYGEAATAFDKARTLGLPWRMLFYQFGPYRAYFNMGRYQDVIDLANATLGARPDLEESFFWRGWAKYSQGDYFGSVDDFRSALSINPNFNDAIVALQTIGATP